MIQLLLPLSLLALPQDLSPAVTGADLTQHVKTLASDEFEGRGPVSVGEEKTIEYISRHFAAAGLSPGNGESWFQEVPLIETMPSAPPTASLSNGEDFVFGRDAMIWSPVPDGAAAVRDSELVFVGYGINAPEYGWNDYAGLDVKGKTVVMLVNDPGYAMGDDELFRGNTMTYYGRWTYKYEEATRQGAAAAFVVHEEGAAGYPWQVVVRSWGGSKFGLDTQGAPSPTKIHGWMTDETAKRVFASEGHDFDALKAKAARRGAQPVPLGVKGSYGLTNASKRSMSKNVIGVLRGAERPDEYVLYCAHWDHLGNKPGVGRDTIYNGAMDNATGTAALLELAAAFGHGERPARSVILLAVTAEESGLLGSKWYAQNPLFPLERTVAGINMDGLNIYGPMEDVVVVGLGASDLDRYLADAATAQGRVLSNEPTPEKGFYYRSDHFNFAKHGVPMLYTHGGSISREHGAEWVSEIKAAYTTERYHQPTDEWDDELFDMEGAAEDVRLFEAVGRRIAGERRWVQWSKGNEFKAAREASAEVRR